MGLFDELFGRKKKPLEAVQVQREPEVKHEVKEEKEVKLTKKEKQELEFARYNVVQKDKETAVALTELSTLNGQLVVKMSHMEDEIRRLHKEQLDKHEWTHKMLSDTQHNVDSIKQDYAKGREVKDSRDELLKAIHTLKEIVKFVPEKNPLKVQADNAIESLSDIFDGSELQKKIIALLSSNSQREFRPKEIADALGIEDKGYGYTNLHRALDALNEQRLVIKNKISAKVVTFKISPTMK